MKLALVFRVQSVLVLSGCLERDGVQYTLTRSRVPCDLIVGVVVHALDDVNFAIVWPEGAFSPKCWPHRASIWNVKEINDPETADIVEVFRGNSHLQGRDK